MGKYPSRNYCELCGKRLEKPETDSRKLAVCKKCTNANMLGFQLSVNKEAKNRRKWNERYLD